MAEKQQQQESKKALFEIFPEHLDTGLRSIPVGYCITSHVNPEKGLYYCNTPVSSLTAHEPEEVIHLLLKGHLPSKEEKSAFSQKLAKYRELPRDLCKHIEALPKGGHPMKMLSSALLMHEMLEPAGQSRDEMQEDLLKVIARAPQICAHIINFHGGFKPQEYSQEASQNLLKGEEEEGYIERFCSQLHIPNKGKDLVEAMRLFNILHYDHGGGNLSCFTGKVVASGHEDLWGALSAAMSALEGPKHGRANQDCLEQIKELHEILGDTYTKEGLKSLLQKRLEEKKLLYGFGHAVLRVEDPRASIFYEKAMKQGANNTLVKLALDLREVGTQVLKENPKISNPYPNVDAISGILLHSCGFPYPQYFTLLFGMSRIVGIAIQVFYERFYARDGKGAVIVRPKYIYKERGDLSLIS